MRGSPAGGGAAAGAGAGAATFLACAGVVAAVAASGGVTVPSFWCGRLSVLGSGWGRLRGATATGASGTVSATIATVSSASPVLYVLHGEAQVACASRTMSMSFESICEDACRLPGVHAHLGAAFRAFLLG